MLLVNPLKEVQDRKKDSKYEGMETYIFLKLTFYNPRFLLLTFY